MNTALLGARRLHPISRRSFVRTSAGALAAGAAVGSGLWRPALALTKQPADPVPIPGGSPQIPGFHVFGPGFPGLDPADAEPATITDFNGFIGLGYISGTVSRRNTQTGEIDELPFLGSDMRFMHGVYRGTDGQIRRGTFGFVWIDVFEPGSGDQIDDMNPGITASGLFWTTRIPADAVEVHPGSGRARLRVEDLRVTDFGNIPNALFGGGPEPVPAVVSYEIRWAGESHPVRVVNPADGFAAEFVRGSAQMEWSARVGEFEFVSAPLETSSSIFAEVGHERNGMFAA